MIYDTFELSEFNFSHIILPPFSSRFVDSGEMSESFPYRTKALFAFEDIDGAEVCFFGMHVQEYGSDCPQPNQRYGGGTSTACAFVSFQNSSRHCYASVLFFQTRVHFLPGQRPLLPTSLLTNSRLPRNSHRLPGVREEAGVRAASQTQSSSES